MGEWRTFPWDGRGRETPRPPLPTAVLLMEKAEDGDTGEVQRRLDGAQAVEVTPQ